MSGGAAPAAHPIVPDRCVIGDPAAVTARASGQAAAGRDLSEPAAMPITRSDWPFQRRHGSSRSRLPPSTEGAECVPVSRNDQLPRVTNSFSQCWFPGPVESSCRRPGFAFYAMPDLTLWPRLRVGRARAALQPAGRGPRSVVAAGRWPGGSGRGPNVARQASLAVRSGAGSRAEVIRRG